MIEEKNEENSSVVERGSEKTTNATSSHNKIKNTMTGKI
jgi:hypothetical protein